MICLATSIGSFRIYVCLVTRFGTSQGLPPLYFVLMGAMAEELLGWQLLTFRW